MDILVTYDIETITPAGAQRLAKIAKVCESFGIRAQCSVFECRLSETMLARLITSLSATMDPSRDSVNIYRLRTPIDECRTSLGRPPHRTLGKPWIL